MRAVLALMWLLHWLPLPILGRLGEALGTVLYYALKKRRRIALTNLRLCFPEKSEEDREQIARRHFQLYARSVLERSLLWWASEKRLRHLIHVDPAVPVTAIDNQATILLCPHFVSLDVAGIATVLETPLCSMYTRQRNQVFDRQLEKGRRRFRAITLVSRADGIKPILRALKQGIPYFMLPDMDFGRKDAEFVPFFNIPAATLTAPARIAAAAKAQVIPVIATVLPDYRGWRVRYLPAWENYPGDDILSATRHMNRAIEQAILEAPAEYFWAHRRFKTRPEGEASVYQ